MGEDWGRGGPAAPCARPSCWEPRTQPLSLTRETGPQAADRETRRGLAGTRPGLLIGGRGEGGEGSSGK